MTSVPEYPREADSDHSDTNPEEMIHAEIRIRPPIVNAGHAIPCSCLICKLEVESRMALYRHMHMNHPHDKPYSCQDCGANHNNLKELSSHHSNVHRSRTVSCSQCDYSCISQGQDASAHSLSHNWLSVSKVWKRIPHPYGVVTT